MLQDQQDRRRLQSYLLAGEQLLWTGRPRQGILFRPADTLLIPFSLAWGGFAIFWNVSVWTMPAPLPFALVGLPFLAMGIYMILGRFLHDAAIRRSQVYAVTNQRVISLRDGRRPKVQTLELGYLPMLELKESGRGGTISFEPGSSWSDMWSDSGWGMWVPSASPTVRFASIDEPRRVYELIRRESDRRRRESAPG